MDVRPVAASERDRRPHPTRHRRPARGDDRDEALLVTAAGNAGRGGAGDGLRRSRADRQRSEPPGTGADRVRGAGGPAVKDMVCNPLITDPFVFPRRADNRAGLSRISYRIGRYADFVEAMTRRIDAAPELSTWTHRD